MQSTGFPQRLSEARICAGISQTELASRANIAPGQVNRYESGKNTPRPHILSKLAGALGVNAKWLAEGDGPRDSDSFTVYGEELDVRTSALPNGGMEIAVDMDDRTADIFKTAASNEGLSLDAYLKKTLFEGIASRVMEKAKADKLSDSELEALAMRVARLLKSREAEEQGSAKKI